MNLNQKGVAHLLVLVLLLAGVAGGTALVQQKTNLFPKAAQNKLKVEQLPNQKNKPQKQKPNKGGMVKLKPPEKSQTSDGFGQVKVQRAEILNNLDFKAVVDAEVKKLEPNKTYLLGICNIDGVTCSKNDWVEMTTNPAGNGIFKNVELSIADKNKLLQYKFVVVEKLNSNPTPSKSCSLSNPCLAGEYRLNNVSEPINKVKPKNKKDKDASSAGDFYTPSPGPQ